MANHAKFGSLNTADDAVVLSDAFRLDGNAPAQEITSYNAAVDGAIDRFGRKELGLGRLEAPFYLCRVVPGVFQMRGGLRIDTDAHVQRKGGGPVPNHFAGGGAAGAISGRAGALGNGLLTAIAQGRLAALAAARDIEAGS